VPAGFAAEQLNYSAVADPGPLDRFERSLHSWDTTRKEDFRGGKEQREGRVRELRGLHSAKNEKSTPMSHVVFEMYCTKSTFRLHCK